MKQPSNAMLFKSVAVVGVVGVSLYLLYKINQQLKTLENIDLNYDIDYDEALKDQ